jgi:hypothetical protein
LSDFLANPFTTFSVTLAKLAGLDLQADQAMANYRDGMNGCRHTKYQLILINCVNGTVQYKSQCQECGAKSGAIAFKKLPRALRDTATDEDETLRERWFSKHAPWLVRGKRLRREAAEIRWQPGFYTLYMASPEWANKRLAVLKRAGDWCELCHESPAEEVHHQSYAKLGNEPLEDLIAVCGPCHRETHERREAALATASVGAEEWD